MSIVGVVLVMVGSVGLGFYFSAKETFRVRDLGEFKKALMILSSEIDFMRSTLSEACKNIAKRSNGSVGDIFENFSKLLAEGEGETAYQLWLTAMETGRARTFLAAEDRVVIEDFGKTLGYLDKEMQKNAITYVVDYIDEKTTALQKAADKNKRMYHSLGIAAGLLVTVILW